MDKNNHTQNTGTDQEEIMNRVNQTFDRISQDVKGMIQGTTEQQDQNRYS